MKMKKDLGIILIVLGALLLVLCSLVPFMNDLADQNWYTWGSVVLIVAGLLTHIYMKKKIDE
jgi:Mn2+/Fe2+ NRAMP family transporter